MVLHFYICIFSCPHWYLIISFDLIVLQGWVTLQWTRDSAFSRGYLSARSVTGFLSDVYSAAADEVGKIHIIADERVCIYIKLCVFVLLSHYACYVCDSK